MREALSGWIEQAARIARIDTLLYVCGSPTDAANASLDARARKTVLIAADLPGLGHTGRNVRVNASVRAAHLVISASESPTERFQRANYAYLSGLADPTTMLGRFPGLRVEETEVECRSAEEAIALAGAAAGARNLFVLDFPMRSAACLQVALGAEGLCLYGDILVRAFGDGLPHAMLRSMWKQGFHVLDRNTSDPDFPTYWFRQIESRPAQAPISVPDPIGPDISLRLQRISTELAELGAILAGRGH